MRAQLGKLLTILTIATCFATASFAQQGPQIVKKNGHYAFMLNGRPFLILAGQINNSSAWPSTMPDVWPVIKGMHANTVEAPVYWEQLEPEPGKFDFSNVDMLVDQARAHHVHLILLWFGTWKNGEDHYVPEWIKTDPQRYPASSTRVASPSRSSPPTRRPTSMPTALPSSPSPGIWRRLTVPSTPSS